MKKINDLFYEIIALKEENERLKDKCDFCQYKRGSITIVKNVELDGYEALKKENKDLSEKLKNSVQLLCKVGDMIFATRIGKKEIFEIKVTSYSNMFVNTKGINDYFICGVNQDGANECFSKAQYKSKNHIVSWFLTKPEAEARLKELQKED